MKKVLPILLALLILLSSTCFAAYTPDPERWIFIASDTKNSRYFIDTKTIHYSNDGDTVNVWVCAVPSQKNLHSFQNIELSYSNRTFLLLYFVDYNTKKNKPLASRAYNTYEQVPEPIVPNSLAETLFYYFFPK